MSSTRHAKLGSPSRQERFCSSPEFDRGLLGNLVAKRCSVLNGRADRELIWFLQLLSREGGLSRFVAEIAERFPERNATLSMQRFGLKVGQIYNAAQVKAVRAELICARDEFLLSGELSARHILDDDPGETEKKAAQLQPNSYSA